MFARGSTSRQGFAGDVPRRRNWLNGGTCIDSAGTASAQQSWGPGNAQTLAVDQLVGFFVAMIPSAGGGAGAAPTIGEQQIDEIFGSVYFNAPGVVSGVYHFGVGIYVSRFNYNTSKWEPRYVCYSSEATRDDWLFLRTVVQYMPLNAGATAITGVEVRVAIPRPVVIGGGEALCVVCHNGPYSPATGTIGVVPYLRARVSNAT
jgi:hypothetical protein